MYEIENTPMAELRKVQDCKVNALLRYAIRHVPYYSEWAKLLGLDPENVSITDFPIIDKSVMLGNEALFMSDQFKKEKLHSCRTSGSTGEPFLFYKARGSFDYTYATLWRGLLRYGIRPGDKRMLVKGLDESQTRGPKKIVSRYLYNKLNRCLAIDAHFLCASSANLEKAVCDIIKYRPDYFHG